MISSFELKGIAKGRGAGGWEGAVQIQWDSLRAGGREGGLGGNVSSTLLLKVTLYLKCQRGSFLCCLD